MSAIHEEDFLGFSYGFRPKRSQHDALDALIVGISSKKVNFILDADIRSFFTEVSQQWVVRFLEHRIGDTRILRLVATTAESDFSGSCITGYGSSPFRRVKRRSQHGGVDMVQKRRELLLLPLPCGLSYAFQRL